MIKYDRNTPIWPYFMKHMYGYAQRAGVSDAQEVMRSLLEWEKTVEVNGSLEVAVTHHLTEKAKTRGISPHHAVERVFFADRDPKRFMNYFKEVSINEPNKA